MSSRLRPAKGHPKVQGAEHLDVATSSNNIGNAHYSQGDYSKAIEYREKSSAIKTNTAPSPLTPCAAGALPRPNPDHQHQTVQHKKALAPVRPVLSAAAAATLAAVQGWEDKGSPRYMEELPEEDNAVEMELWCMYHCNLKQVSESVFQKTWVCLHLYGIRPMYLVAWVRESRSSGGSLDFSSDYITSYYDPPVSSSAADVVVRNFLKSLPYQRGLVCKFMTEERGAHAKLLYRNLVDSHEEWCAHESETLEGILQRAQAALEKADLISDQEGHVLFQALEHVAALWRVHARVVRSKMSLCGDMLDAGYVRSCRVERTYMAESHPYRNAYEQAPSMVCSVANMLMRSFYHEVYLPNATYIVDLLCLCMNYTRERLQDLPNGAKSCVQLLIDMGTVIQPTDLPLRVQVPTLPSEWEASSPDKEWSVFGGDAPINWSIYHADFESVYLTTDASEAGVTPAHKAGAMARDLTTFERLEVLNTCWSRGACVTDKDSRMDNTCAPPSAVDVKYLLDMHIQTFELEQRRCGLPAGPSECEENDVFGPGLHFGTTQSITSYLLIRLTEHSEKIAASIAADGPHPLWQPHPGPAGEEEAKLEPGAYLQRRLRINPDALAFFSSFCKLGHYWPVKSLELHRYPDYSPVRIAHWDEAYFLLNALTESIGKEIALAGTAILDARSKELLWIAARLKAGYASIPSSNTPPGTEVSSSSSSKGFKIATESMPVHIAKSNEGSPRRKSEERDWRRALMRRAHSSDAMLPAALVGLVRAAEDIVALFGMKMPHRESNGLRRAVDSALQQVMSRPCVGFDPVEALASYLDSILRTSVHAEDLISVNKAGCKEAAENHDLVPELMRRMPRLALTETTLMHNFRVASDLPPVRVLDMLPHLAQNGYFGLRRGMEDGIRILQCYAENCGAWIFALMRYLPDKDLFVQLYHVHLSKRLLQKKFHNYMLERDFVHHLRSQLGASVVQKIEVMLNDVLSGNGTKGEFNAWRTAESARKLNAEDVDGDATITMVEPQSDLPIDLFVDVLSNGAWPIQMTVSACILPSKLDRAQAEFNLWYKSINKGHRLTWLYGQGEAHVRATFVKGLPSYTIECSTLQAVVLCAFDRMPHAVSFKALVERTGIKQIHILKAILASLAAGEHKLLVVTTLSGSVSGSGNNGRDRGATATASDRGGDGENTTIQVAKGFTSGKALTRIKLAHPALADLPASPYHATLERERQFAIDAAVVRSVKHAPGGQLAGSALQGAVDLVLQETGLFVPKMADIMRSVASLVKREFLVLMKEEERFEGTLEAGGQGVSLKFMP